jgi:hypothetical protein
MSIKAYAWAKSIKAGSPTLKAVLCAIADYADDRGRAFPSFDRVAEDTEFTDRAVRKAVAELAALGLLTRQERFRADGGRSTDVLTLQMHLSAPLERGSTPPEPASTGVEGRSCPLEPDATPSGTTFAPITTTELPTNGSEADASGGEAADPQLSVKDLCWIDGKRNLQAAGMTPKEAGDYIGNCLKRGYPHALILEGTAATVESATGDPIRYMGGFLRKADEDGRGTRPRAPSRQKPRTAGDFYADLANGKFFGGSDDAGSDTQHRQLRLISGSRH